MEPNSPSIGADDLLPSRPGRTFEAMEAVIVTPAPAPRPAPAREAELLAALIEGFISPTSLPYALKAGVAILSGGLLVFYFLVLGFPWKAR